MFFCVRGKRRPRHRGGLGVRAVCARIGRRRERSMHVCNSGGEGQKRGGNAVSSRNSSTLRRSFTLSNTICFIPCRWWPWPVCSHHSRPNICPSTAKFFSCIGKKGEKPCVNMSSNLISRTTTAAKSRTEGKCPQGNNSCGERRGCLRKIAHRYIYPLAVTLPSHNSLIDLAKQSPTVLAACPQQSSSLPKAELSPREKRFLLSTENTLH